MKIRELKSEPEVAAVRQQKWQAYEFLKSIYPGDTPGYQEKINSPITQGMQIPALTDMGNAERFVHQHGRNVRYCPPWGKWLIWDGVIWKIDGTGEVFRLAKKTVRSIYGEKDRALDEEHKKKIIKHATKSQASNRLQAMLSLARSEEGIPVLPAQLDNDKWKLNVLNGVLDLKNGNFNSHSCDDLMTKLAPVTYDSKAKCPTWDRFLDEIMGGDKELVAFLQRAIGWSLTGDTSEEALFFLFGTGGNGKSKFENTIQEMLGDYAQQTPTATLIKKRNTGIPNDIARLQGARFVAASETGEGMSLDEGLVKQLTGRDPITARFLRQEYFTFIPEFKLWLATNHKPHIRGTDNGIWRRVHLVPFTVTIPKEKQDLNLADKLRNELPGILNWALEGCLQWQRQGLNPPQSILDATKEYRKEMDIFGNFIEERLVLVPDYTTTYFDLYEEYRGWCKDGGMSTLSKPELVKRLLENEGIKESRNSQARGLKGVAIKSEIESRLVEYKRTKCLIKKLIKEQSLESKELDRISKFQQQWEVQCYEN